MAMSYILHYLILLLLCVVTEVVDEFALLRQQMHILCLSSFNIGILIRIFSFADSTL